MSNRSLLLIILIVAILGFGYFLISGSNESAVPDKQAGVEDIDKISIEESMEGEFVEEEDSMVAYTLEEISKHNNPEDCWLLIDEKVYDVTGFDAKHAGGKAVLEGCGIDATELYETRPMGSGTPHSQKARSFLENYYIGDLE